MRIVTLSVFLILVAICVTAEWPEAMVDRQPSQTQVDHAWRRTNAGWQRSDRWQQQPAEPALGIIHPALFASFELLASLFALIAFTVEPVGR